MTARAEVHAAPVFPADTNASARPSATRFAQTRTEELRLRRSGASAVSSIVDDFARVENVDVARRRRRGRGELAAHDILLADENDLDREFGRRQKGALHDLGRRMIAAHGIQGDANCQSSSQ